MDSNGVLPNLCFGVSVSRYAPVLILFCVLFASPAHSQPKTVRVPADFSTIQAAMNATASNVVDTVLVDPGVYTEAVQFGVKPTRLVSTGGPSVTLIIAPPGQAAVTFGEGPPRGVLNGFTLSNGTAGVAIASGLENCGNCTGTIISNVIVNCGTGISVVLSSPTISYNSILSCSGDAIRLQQSATAVIEGNLISQNGIGIHLASAGSPTIRNNIVRDNLGTGIYLSPNSSPDANISQNLVLNNAGDGIYFPGGFRGPWIINNTIARNSGAGIAKDGSGPDVRIINNIVVGTPALYVGNNVVFGNIQFNDFYSPHGVPFSGLITNLTGVNGNISTNPFFACQPAGDVRLLAPSPAIDAGTNGDVLLSALDLDGRPRIVAGHTNGPSTVDLGAYEFHSSAASSPCFFFVCPSNRAVMAGLGQTSTAVYYHDLFATPGATVTYSPPSGSVFPIGESVVNVNMQFGTNATNCSFGVIVTAYNEFGVALNATNLPWVSFGDATWFAQNAETHDGIAAAKTVTQASSTLRTVLSGPGPLSFWWMRNANSSLSLIVDGVVVASYVPSLVDWKSATINLAPGPHIVDWKLIGGAAWLDQVSYPPLPIPLILMCPSNQVVIAAPGQYSAPVNYPPPFATPGAAVFTSPPSGSLFPAGESIVNVSATYGTNTTNCSFTVTVLTANDFGLALNNTNIDWATSGDASWYMQTNVTRDGIAIQSGAISNSQIATVQTTLAGPGVLTYWWKVSSQTNRDLLFVTLNGSTQAVVSGQVDWQSRASYPGSGAQVFQWSYAKDTNGISGQDAAWLDQVTWVPGAVGPSITTQPANISAGIGMNPVFSVTAAGTPPLTYQWMFNGQNLPGATGSSLVITNVQATNVGTYSVLVMNQVGTNVSTSAMLALAQVLAWGANSYGQANVPVGLTNVAAIAGGWHHSVVLRTDGTVIAWGDNVSGQTNVPPGLSNVVAIASRSGNHNMALRAEGTVVVWGERSFGLTNVPPGLSNVVAISAGGSRCLALKSDGTAVSWGNTGAGGVPAGLSNVVAISAGDTGNLFLRGDGTVAAIGTSVPSNVTNIIAIAAGGQHYLALRADGTIIAWGSNPFGQATVPAGLSQVVAIGAGDYHSMALRADGTVVVWGRYYVSPNYLVPVLPAGLANVQAIAAGSDHDLVFFGNGSVPEAFKLTDMHLIDGSFNVSVPTEHGRVYRLEYKTSLSDPAWIPVQWVAGNGTNQVLSDPSSSGSQRFYRASRW